MCAQHVEGGVAGVGHVAVADDHRGRPAEALGPERRGGERGRHREEQHRARLLGHEDRAELRAGDVHEVHGDIGLAAGGGGDGPVELQRIGRVGGDGGVGEAGGTHIRERALGGVGDDDGARRRPRAGGRRATSAGRRCPPPPMRTTVSPGLTRVAVRDGAPATSSAASAIRSGMSSGSTANGLDANSTAVPVTPTWPWCMATRIDALEPKRGQRQRDQRRDPLARAAPRARPRAPPPPRVPCPISIPPDPVTGLCILPRWATIARDGRGDTHGVTRVAVGQLAEARRVEVQPR